MGKDALEVAATKASFVLAKALDNLSLCQNFMGLLGRTVYMAHERNKNIFKVKIGKPYFIETPLEGAQIRADIVFAEEGAVADTLNFMDRVDGMKEFVGKRSGNLAKVLDKNPSYMEFLAETVRLMETHALKLGRPFGELEVVRAVITQDNKLIMVLS